MQYISEKEFNSVQTRDGATETASNLLNDIPVAHALEDLHRENRIVERWARLAPNTQIAIDYPNMKFQNKQSAIPRYVRRLLAGSRLRSHLHFS